MGNGAVSVAAATAIVGYDLLKDTRYKRMSDRNRVITEMRLTGSAAAGDTEVELFIGTDYIGNFVNTATGFGNKDDDQGVNATVPAGEEIFLIVKDAPTTDPINANMKWAE